MLELQFERGNFYRISFCENLIKVNPQLQRGVSHTPSKSSNLLKKYRKKKCHIPTIFPFKQKSTIKIAELWCYTWQKKTATSDPVCFISMGRGLGLLTYRDLYQPVKDICNICDWFPSIYCCYRWGMTPILGPILGGRHDWCSTTSWGAANSQHSNCHIYENGGGVCVLFWENFILNALQFHK